MIKTLTHKEIEMVSGGDGDGNEFNPVVFYAGVVTAAIAPAVCFVSAGLAYLTRRQSKMNGSKICLEASYGFMCSAATGIALAPIGIRLMISGAGYQGGGWW